jgi:hypothetical protein
MKELRDKLEHDLNNCEELMTALRSGAMQTYEVNGQGMRRYTSQSRLGDYQRMSANLRQVIAQIDALGSARPH